METQGLRTTGTVENIYTHTERGITMYHFIQRCQQLFGLLQDDLSKEIFKARLLLDVEPSMTNAMRLLCLNEAIQQNPEELAKRLAWKDVMEELNCSGKKIIIYGAGGCGSVIASQLQYEKVAFYGFCDRRADSLKDGVLGKPVVSPEYLFQHSDECYVLPTDFGNVPDSIMHVLQENHFPQNHILRYHFAPLMEKQYFDFPSLYRHGTAFVDAGCFDCATDYAFSAWCDGDYSQIFAFEPDPKNYEICLEKAKDIRDLRLIQAGLADRSGTAEFILKGSASSRLSISDTENASSAQKTIVPITTIDEVVGDETVGMVKMDIEGAEFAALQGAEHIIRRDRPLLAICVYHLPGDTITVMDYIQRTVPEYRFWLRHYTGPVAYETVLYASVDPL